MYTEHKDPYKYLFHEPLQTQLFKRVVKEGQTVVDIGAHIGYYTLLAAKLVGRRGRVLAFEPDLENYKKLLQNVKLNEYKHVYPVKKAISDIVGTAKLWLHPSSSSNHSLFGFGERTKYINVSVTTLDEFFKRKGYGPVDVVKIDVEGAELSVLLGMEKIIEHNQELKLFVEFDSQRMRLCGQNPKRFVGKLVEHGFKIYLINQNKKRVDLIEPKKMVKASDENFFLTR